MCELNVFIGFVTLFWKKNFLHSEDNHDHYFTWLFNEITMQEFMC